ncbi:MAG: T9SS type A sorting domain-containing protein [Flavobacterium sp.]|nr:MAG: T9SS type A sorting domain-containing protein [Flavobacterium sp.]
MKMKKSYKLAYTLAILLVTASSWSQFTVVQWNFNGTSATTVPGGPSNPTPSTGSGTLALVGGTALTSPTDFPSGASSGGSSDPVVTTPNTNFAWGVTNYAALGAESKQRGVQINVNTTNYTGISLKFDQRLSNTSNNTYVVQYTTDRSAASPVWVDKQTFTFTPAATGTGDTWYNMRTVDFSTIPALNNNSQAAFRIVSAFDPGVGNYTASTSTATYAPTGTTRYDMVTVLAENQLGVPSHTANSNAFIMSPNPSNHDIVNFSQSHDIEVYDVTGKTIFKGTGVSSLDTKNFASGIYIVRVETGASQKLIVR